VLLAWGFVEPVLLLMADMALHRTSLDEGISLLLSPRAPRAMASKEPRDAYYVYPVYQQGPGNQVSN